ncbi:hypothetical protein GCM10007392_45530 [Saccharospirillum salsuginis]|uniref:Uncharacterized protein n=1 Tax=Saccharospirillum salsuginis TaxID=418750 RepID=A0A918NJQ7_9GAMM|nr:hypothetical protein GCM10007392_45530 [Saccharospirillum salsuginis]
MTGILKHTNGPKSQIPIIQLRDYQNEWGIMSALSAPPLERGALDFRGDYM